MKSATKKTVCPECGKGSLVEKHGDYETVYLDREGRSHPLVVPGLAWLQCTSCDEVVLDDAAMTTIEAARRRALGLLSPQQIRDLRTRLSLTQAAMSELLGIGTKTYCRWESGSYMQSEASDRYLRLLIAEPRNLQLLHEIAFAKERPESVEVQSEEQMHNIFPYIASAVVLREHSFVQLLSEGLLCSEAA